MASIQERLNTWWATRRPEQKFKVKVGAGIGAMILVAWAVSSSVHGKKHVTTAPKASQTILLDRSANLSAADQQAEIQAMQRQLQELKGIVTSGSSMTRQQVDEILSEERRREQQQGGAGPAAPGGGTGGGGADNAQMAALRAQINQLQQQIHEQPAPQVPQPQQPLPSVQPGTSYYGAANIIELGGPGKTAGANDVSANANGGSSVPPPPSAPPGAAGQVHVTAPSGVLNGLKTMGGQPDQPGGVSAGPAVVKVSSKAKAYIPPGSIITGVTLNGVNVGTGAGAQANPQIVEVRVKEPVIMPNGFRINLHNCMIIATGYGDLAAERVYLRPTTLSCVSPTGASIQSAIKGYVVGDDGIAGMKGVVVSHQGELLEKGMLAGLISGFGSSFQPTTVSPLALNPGGTTQYQYPSVSNVVGNSISSGASNAASLIAKFYLEQAQKLQPTLQINPGTSVDIILESGANVLKKGMTSAQLARVAWESSGEPSGNKPPIAPQSNEQQQAQAAVSGFGKAVQYPAGSIVQK